MIWCINGVSLTCVPSPSVFVRVPKCPCGNSSSASVRCSRRWGCACSTAYAFSRPHSAPSRLVLLPQPFKIGQIRKNCKTTAKARIPCINNSYAFTATILYLACGIIAYSGATENKQSCPWQKTGPFVKRKIRCTCWRTLYINSYKNGAYTNITNPLLTRRPSLTCHGESRGDRSPQEEAARRQHDHILLRLQLERKDVKRDIHRLILLHGDVEVTRKTLNASVENTKTLMGKTFGKCPRRLISLVLSFRDCGWNSCWDWNAPSAGLPPSSHSPLLLPFTSHTPHSHATSEEHFCNLEQISC